MSAEDLERARAVLARDPEDAEAFAETVRLVDRRFGFPEDVGAARRVLEEGELGAPPGVAERVLAAVAARQRVALGVPGPPHRLTPVALGRWILAADGSWLVGVFGHWVVRRRGPRFDVPESWKVPGGGAGWTEIVDVRVGAAGERLVLLARLQRWRTEDGERTRIQELDMVTGTWEPRRYRADDPEDGDPPTLWLLPDLVHVLVCSRDGRKVWIEALPGPGRGRERVAVEDPHGRVLRYGGISPDGQQVAWIAGGGGDGPAQVMVGSAEGGRLEARGPLMERGPDRVDFSACGKYLGGWRTRRGEGTLTGGLWVIDAASGEVVRRADLPTIGIEDLWLGPGARWGVARGSAGWWMDLEAGRTRLLDDACSRGLQDRNRAGLALVGLVSPSLEDLGSWVLGGPRRPVGPPPETGVHVPRTVAVTDGGAVVRAAFPESDLQLAWDRATGAVRSARLRRGRITGAWLVRCARVDPAGGTRIRVEVETGDGSLIASGEVDFPPGEWELSDAHPTTEHLLFLDGAGQRVALVEREGWRCRWIREVASGRWVDAGFAPDGTPYAVQGHRRRSCFLWLEPADGSERELWWLPGAGSPWGRVAFDADGTHAWLVARHKLYRVGGGEGGGVATLFGKQEQEDEAVAAHPGGLGLARRRRGGKLSWEVPGEVARQEWELPGHLGHGFAFSPEGDELFVADMGHLRILGLEDEEAL